MDWTFYDLPSDYTLAPTNYYQKKSLSFKSLPSSLNMEEIHPLQLQVPARNVTGRSVEAEPGGIVKPCPELPPEVHEMIINELEGETEALKQCALTCRVYRYGAQKLLFNKLTLDFSPGSNPAHEFLGILEASPWIGDYVACLSLRSSGHLSEDTDEKDKWVSRVITALPNIVEMDMGWGLRDFRFCMLDPSSQMAIMSTCENLRSLSLAFTEDVPLAIFDHMLRIETLELQDVRFPKDREVLDAKSWTVPYRIKELTLEYVRIEGAGMIYPFLKKRRFSKGLLETLSIGLNELYWATLSQRVYKGIKWLISGSAKSLKVFDFTVTSWDPVILRDGDLIFNISKMPLLEDLTLCSTIFERVPGMPASPIGLDWFLRQLETIPVGRKLQSIFLRPAIYDPSLCIVESSSPSEELKNFEQTILQEVLPKTEEFRIRFSIWQKAGHSEGPQLAKEKIVKNLPVLQALHLLHFEEYGK